MRVRDLKPSKQYATCEGQLVVPVEPIHANWYWQLNPTKRCAVCRARSALEGGSDGR